MVKRVGTSRTKTRHKFARALRERGKVFITRFIQKFEVGDKVVLKADSSYQKGLYHARFHGRIGTIKGKRGKSYLVEVTDGPNKKKTLIVAPVHLKRLKVN